MRAESAVGNGLTESGTVTFLFTDLVSSTELLDRLGDDPAAELHRVHLGLLRDAAALHGGREVKSLGDGLMVAFPSALHAIACAADMQRHVQEQNRLEPDQVLGIRVGLNAGEAIVEEDDFFGTSVVVAKRLCDHAGSGQVLLSGLVRGLVGTRGDYGFRELGSLELKGLREPVPTWELEWDRSDPAELASAPAQAAEGPGGQPVPPVRVPAALEVTGRAAFLGRESALARLRELLRETDGTSRVVLVVGEPGIGKTRLAAEFAREAHAAGATILYGRCEEEALHPYQPFVEALGHYLSQMPPARLAREMEGRPELHRLLPEVSRRVPGFRQPAAQDPETERFRLFQAIGGVVHEAAASAPLVLVLDDLQWADKPTALLLRHVAHSVTDTSLLLVGAYREAEVGRDHPLAAAISDLRREARYERIALSGLGSQEIPALVAELAGGEPASGLAGSIETTTEGNPFYIEEVVGHLLDSEALTFEGGVLTTTLSLSEAGIPDTVKALIGRRLGRLSDAARETLSIASAVGHEFDATVIEGVSDRSPEIVAEALEEAVVARVLKEVPESLDRYSFTQELYRAALYDELGRRRRVRLHREVAEALESLDPTAQKHLAQLAYHYCKAAPEADAAKAIDYAVRAGRQASENLAFEEAAAQYERALRVLDGSAPDAMRRCELLLARGEAELYAGEFDRAREAYGKAAELADQVDAAEHLAEAALGFRGPIGFEFGVIDRPAIDLLGRALEALGDEATALRACVMASLAEKTLFIEPLERRAALVREAIDIARRSGDEQALARVLISGHVALWGPENHAERIGWAREVARVGESRQDGALAALGRGLESIDLIERDDVAEASVAYGLFENAVQGLRQSYLLWMAATMRAGLVIFRGDLVRGEELAEVARELGQQGQNRNALQLYGAQMAAIRREQGRLAELETGTRAFIGEFPELAIWRCMLAAIYAETDRKDEARRQLDGLATEGFSTIPRDMFWLASMELLAWACFEIESAEHAPRVYDLLKPHAAQRVSGLGVFLPCVHYSLGRLTTVMARWDEAVDHFEQALAADAAAGTYWEAHTQHNYAQMLLRRGASGDRERALELLDLSQGTAERVQLTSLGDKIRATRRLALGEAAEEPVPRRALGARLTAIREDATALAARGSRVAVKRLIRDADDAEIERRFGSAIAQRTIFSAMAAAFQSRVAFGFEGAITFELFYSEGGAEEREPDVWTLTVGPTRAVAQRGGSPAAKLKLRLPVADFVRIVAAELNPVGRMLEGRIEVQGDLTLAVRVVEMFGGAMPAPASEGDGPRPRQRSHPRRGWHDRVAGAGDGRRRD